MSYFDKRYHPPGTPPGTLSDIVADGATEQRILLVQYNETSLQTKQLKTVTECEDYLGDHNIVWLHLQGKVETDNLKALGELFCIHTLVLEDVINVGQRPKVDIFDEQIFVTLGLTTRAENRISNEQINLFLGKNYVISFSSGAADPFHPIRQRLGSPGSKTRKKAADYLFYCLIDVIIDRGFPVLESLGEEIESIEEGLLEGANNSTMHGLHIINRQLLMLRKNYWPVRDVLNQLSRDEFTIIDSKNEPYFKDCYDHSVQIIDILEIYRETTANLLDIYLSSSSQKLNAAMRTLTTIATIFMPLTFIVGVYGMNFSVNEKSPWAMPELNWYYGYPMVWLLLIGVALLMWAYFRRKKWW